MIDKERVLNRTCKYIRSTLLSQKGARLSAAQLNRDYHGLVGEFIPFAELSFSCLEDFLKSIPDVCEVSS